MFLGPLSFPSLKAFVHPLPFFSCDGSIAARFAPPAGVLPVFFRLLYSPELSFSFSFNFSPHFPYLSVPELLFARFPFISFAPFPPSSCSFYSPLLIHFAHQGPRRNLRRTFTPLCRSSASSSYSPATLLVLSLFPFLVPIPVFFLHGLP